MVPLMEAGGSVDAIRPVSPALAPRTHPVQLVNVCQTNREPKLFVPTLFSQREAL